MAKLRLTHRNIENLTVKGRWLTDYWDERLSCFGVRVAPNGRKSFVVRYNSEDGRKRRMTLGAFPLLSLADARDKAREVLAAVARGGDPQEKKAEERKAATFGELAEVYLERHAKVKKRSWREDERILENDLLPRWGRRKAKSIQRSDVSELLDGIMNRGAPIMANRVRALVSKIYNFGIGRSIVEHNPCLGVPMPAKARKRERVLTAEEIRRVWCALDHEDEVMAATFKMRLLTAQRGNEVLNLRWEQIDGHWWTIPGETAKNGLAHRVFLAQPTLDLLADLRSITGGYAWVFASPRRKGAPVTAIRKAAERIVKRSGVDFVPHDLRRTAGSYMTSMKVPRLVVSKILNHVEGGVTSIYDRYGYDEEKRHAWVVWADRLQQILLGTEEGGLPEFSSEETGAASEAEILKSLTELDPEARERILSLVGGI